MDMEFTCPKCKKVYPLTKEFCYFHTKGKNFGRRTGPCKNCRKAHYLKWYPKRGKEVARAWAVAHRDYHNKRKWKERARPEKRYYDYQKNAQIRGLPFPITLEEFKSITSQVCHYCGKFSKDREFTGVDRKDNSLGYTLTNCLPCCAACNHMKHNSLYDEFLEKINQIAALHPTK